MCFDPRLTCDGVAVRSMIRDLFRPEAYTAEDVPRLADEELEPEERACVARAVPERRAEFATARVLARRGLAALGVPRAPIVLKDDRSPAWPPGIVGSISHTSGLCAIVLDRAPPMRAVGLDVERLRPLAPELVDSIATPRERAWLAGHPPEIRGELGLLLFSAKEAYYKCQYPITGGFLDFLDVELAIALDEGCFEARVLRPAWPSAVARLEGRFARRAGMVLCGVELSTSPQK